MRIVLLLLALVVACESPPPPGDAPSDAEVPGDIEYDPPPAIEPEHTTLEEELELVGHDDAPTIVVPTGAARPVVLAGQEVRRYMYLRTGVLPGLVSADALPDGDVLLVSPDSHLLVEGLRESLGTTTAERGFLIKSVADGQRTVLVITGHDEVATLHGAYRFAEHLGVGFGLDGDAIPDERIALSLTGHDEIAAPLLETRGLLPFHDFPAGPDFWDTDDYLVVIGQMPKLGLNHIALHTYPRWSTTEEAGLDEEGDRGAPQGPEPSVWIGLPEDIGDGAEVRWSYPAYYAHTARPDRIWGLVARDTDLFHGGADRLFADSAHGSSVMGDGNPTDVESSNAVFARTGEMLDVAFGRAHQLGIRTAIGTELPLGLEPSGPEVGVDWVRGVPPALQDRLREQGLDPADPAVVRDLYRGIFRRIMQTHHLDEYWLWTWEGWSMHGVSRDQIDAITEDMRLAFEAAEEVDAPFRIAVGGWIVGTADAPAEFDEVLPSGVPFFSLWDEADGMEEIRADRVRYPATWLEEDWGLAQPQLELRRLHADVSAALTKSCDGITAKHWRTRILNASLAALQDLTWVRGTTSGGFGPPSVEMDRDEWIEARYLDWASRQFGEEAAPEIAAIFARLDRAGEDGANSIPRPLGWDTDDEDSSNSSPVAIMPADNGRSWEEAQDDYAFVGELETLRDDVVGPGNRERYDYWLASFQVLRLMGEYSYELTAFESAMEEDDWEEALETRRRMARLWERIMSLQARKATNSSDLGEIVHLDTLNWGQLMERRWDVPLQEGLGRSLPEDANPSREYSGPARVVVTPARNVADRGESLTIEALVLGDPSRVTLTHRPMGRGDEETLEMSHVARGVWTTTLGPLTEDIEYRVEAETPSGTVFWPATAPEIPHTVVVMPFGP